MTYREIAHQILDMTEEQKDQDATIYDAEQAEFYPVEEISFEVAPADVLDEGHPFFIINHLSKMEG